MFNRMPYVALGLVAALAAGAVIADSGTCDPAPPGATKPTVKDAASAGMIKVAHADWTMTVTGDKTGKQPLTGGEKPVSLAADTYTVNSYTEKVTSADGKTSGTLTMTAPKMKFEVKAGQTAEVAIGSPVVFVLTATPGKDTVTFGVTMFDTTKTNPIAKLTDASGKAFAAPKLTIDDAKGNEVAKADMHYG
jgi:hypothetical protein